MKKTLEDIWQEKVIVANEADLCEFIFVYNNKYYHTAFVHGLKWSFPTLVEVM